MRVLLIDDERRICRVIQRGLRSRGIDVDVHHEVVSFLEAVRTGDHQAILIDWNLRTIEGTVLCAQLRGRGETRPIAILSGKLEINHAKDLAARAGADDFISKPITMDDLAQRIEELARLPARSPCSSGTYKLDTETSGAAAFELRPDGSVVLHEHRIRLGAKEHALFMYLVAHLGNDVTNEELIENVFASARAKNPDEKKRQDHLVHVHVNRLRKRFGSALVIRTVAGGYRIDSVDSLQASKKV